MSRKLIKLFGGHRNKVFRIDGKVKIVWKDGFKREKQIREGVLLENFVAVHTGIKSRMLVDKSKPVEEENEELVTYFHYARGEIRYPWNLEEISSAAKLLTKLHQAINPSISAKGRSASGGNNQQSAISNYRLHLDFARGNVLFQSGSSDAVGVIDFETTAPGPVEQELGRSLSFILVDTPVNSDRDNPLRSIPQGSSLLKRWNFFLTNYSLPYRKENVVEWTRKYLKAEDYGSLNHVRDEVLRWVMQKYAKSPKRKNSG